MPILKRDKAKGFVRKGSGKRDVSSDEGDGLGLFKLPSFVDPMATSSLSSRGEKEEMARAINAGEVLTRHDESLVKAYHIGQLYYQQMEKYYQLRFPVDWKKRLRSNKGAIGCCSRAWAQCEILGVSPEDYVESQFWAINKSFGRHPRWQDLASAGALKRCEQWVQRSERGQLKTPVNISLIAVYAPRGNMSSAVMEYEEKVLAKMSKQWGSESKVWEMFGEPGNDELFSEAFKKTRPLWRAMYGVVNDQP